MKATRSLYVGAGLLLVAAAICALSGCAGKKNVWGDVESGLILEYRMKQGDVLKYETVHEGVEKVEVMGQTNESATSKSYTFTVESKGMKGGNLLLGITIDSMEAGLKSAQGEFEADTEDVLGKSFDMVLTPLGDEVDLSTAEEIKYSAGPMGDRSIKNDFESIFSNLAGRPVKVGDSWESPDSLYLDQGNTQLTIKTVSVHTLDGYETMMGLECARIVSKFTGTVTGTGEQMGAPLVIDGTTEGSETWYFAYKEGYLVNASADVDSDLSVTVQMGQEMKIPVTSSGTLETTLIK
ncbi:MAG: hypothetical protein PVJ42_07075 [bacterium]|jgi:hypothetical protein